MANTAVRPVHAYGAPAAISPHPDHDTTFTEAQSKAREWADKALHFHEVDDTEQTREAARQAEYWLGRMRAFENVLRKVPHVSGEAESYASRPQPRVRDSVAISAHPLLSIGRPAARRPTANDIGSRATPILRRVR